MQADYDNFNNEINNKLYITQYDIKLIFNKDDRFRFWNFIKRNFRPKFKSDVIIDGKLKKNIGFYSVDEILNLLRSKTLKIKTYNNPVYHIYKTFAEYIKTKNIELLEPKLKQYVINFPKPKYYRGKWKRWYQIKQEIKKLKALKRKLRKQNNDKQLQEVIDKINKLKQRRDELAKILKIGVSKRKLNERS
jgi:hypothetical protein